MASTQLKLDYKAAEKLGKAIANYKGRAGKEIDDVLHKEGGPLISDAIMQILPSSGRTWAGKIPAAKSTQPFRQYDGSLSVTVATKTKYNYLYFPDDGTNTRHHVGYKGKPREFMKHGAEIVQDKIVDMCVNRLTKMIGE